MIAVGVVVVLLSIFANPLGLGGQAAFGYLQALGVVIGLVAMYAGYRIRLQAIRSGAGRSGRVR